MAERSVVARLRAEVSDYVRNMGAAKKATDQVTDSTKTVGTQGSRSFADVTAWVGKNEQAVSELTTKLGLVGIGVTALAALAVKKFADFDQAMSAVAATGDDARANISALRDAAIDAGARTVYSATEAAGAIEELSKAGLSAADILGGGLDGALALAAAGSLDVAEAAGYTSVALQQFKLRGTDAAHVSDLLAAGAGKAMGDVSDLGMALKQSGLVASQTGLSIEETTAALAAFAQAGLLGSDAGTSLKTMLQRLTPQSAEARAMFDELGISAYDAQGQFVGLEDLAGQLQSRMRGLTPEARNAALSVMFGSDAVRAATVLYNEGATGIAKWTEAVDDQGYASEVAATKLDNLKGDLEGLAGSIDTTLIRSGSGANDILRNLVQGADSFVDALGQIPAPVLSVITIIAGGAGLAALGAAGFGKLVIAAVQFQEALVSTGAVSQATATKITGNLGKVAHAAGLAVASITAMVAAGHLLSDTVDKSTLGVNELSAALRGLKADGSDATAVFEDINRPWLEFGNITASIEDLDDLQAKLKEIADPNGLQQAQGAVARFVDVWDSSSIGQYAQRLEDVGQSLSDLTATDLPAATKQFTALYNAAGGTEEAGAMLLKTMPALKDTLVGIADSSGLATDDATLLKIALGELTPAVDESSIAAQQAAEATKVAQEALDNWRQSVADADGAFIDLQGAYDGVIAKNTEIAESTADATSSSRDSWQDYYDGVSVSADEYIAGLQEQVAAQEAWESNLLDLSARVRDGMTGDMRTAAEQMIDELINLGPEGAAQVQLLHDMTDEQFGQVVSLWQAKGAQAVTEFVSQVESYRSPVIEVLANTYGAQAAVDGFITMNNGRRLSVKVDAQGGTVYQVAGSSVKFTNENGALMEFADGAGIDARGNTVARVSQIADGGRNIMWAEPATGWEAYISGKPSQRNRNIDIWQQVGKRLGVTAFADGGGMYAQRSGWAAPVAAATPSLAGLEIVGTLDTPFGPAQVRGVVRSELAEQERSIRAGVR